VKLVSSDETLSQALRSGDLFGTWCGFSSFCSVETMAGLGFSFVVLDMQHTELRLDALPGLLGAFRPGGSRCVVRAPSNSYHAINWLCDMGVDGVLVPMVNSAADALRAVEAAKFPPLGKRSFGPFRAARYGAALDDYMALGDENTALIVQVEDAEGARNIDSLLDVAGIDAVFMGPNDLAYSMLKPGEMIAANPGQWTAFARTPPVMDLCRHVMRRCRARGVPFGMTAGSMAEAHEWVREGASFATFGSDFLFLRTGARTLCESKSEER
jgi:2-keto-3-deoxy-L-rhamnonate aldolase RhmA